MNILYAGTPNSSAEILKYLAQNDSINVKGVITQPDKAGKRGKKLNDSPVSLMANSYDLDLFKPHKLNNKDFKEKIEILEVDFLIVVAYGKILPKWLLQLPSVSSINIHFSLLPKYRGASPIQSALLNGDKETGITFIEMSEKLDSGNIISTEKTKIFMDDNKVKLETRLTGMSIKKINNVLIESAKQNKSSIKQDDSNASYCQKILKVDSITNFNDTSINIFNKFRAFIEWPGLAFYHNDTLIKIHGLEVLDQINTDKPGTIYKFDSTGLYINTIDSVIVITHLQLPNRNIISSSDAFNSYKDFFR
ncbi:MAG: methionyl-tRNA formyltransferase [SAR86 cluster bacterium]|uniref:Methionyl-tRNA formyltransferase n=1 Tax=SAR86 cluster bacterium TaxID=2030880 RepID=A0A520MV44_9GAMM|nr:MAG: methionyl-tRNA formyltransferase [SAR86 cluster bacterium]